MIDELSTKYQRVLHIIETGYPQHTRFIVQYAPFIPYNAGIEVRGSQNY